MMRLSKRDKDIISDLKRFRCLSRDDIAEIHFRNVKDNKKAANTTMLRLYRQGLVERSTNFEPYVYMPADSTMKKNSQKAPHFLAIVEVYRELLQYEKPTVFTVEPKYHKGLAEPDAFTIFKRSPVFIECQRSTYSQKVMAEKIQRYEALFESGMVFTESWQPRDSMIFPAVLLLTQTRYAIRSTNFPIIQVSSINEFMKLMNVNQSSQSVKERNIGSIKIKTG